MKVDTNAGTVTIEHMYLMLEGQVAALSSGRLLPEEAHTFAGCTQRQPAVPGRPVQLFTVP